MVSFVRHVSNVAKYTHPAKTVHPGAKFGGVSHKNHMKSSTYGTSAGWNLVLKNHDGLLGTDVDGPVSKENQVRQKSLRLLY
jgi:hypothetical protein